MRGWRPRYATEKKMPACEGWLTHKWGIVGRGEGGGLSVRIGFCSCYVCGEDGGGAAAAVTGVGGLIESQNGSLWLASSRVSISSIECGLRVVSPYPLPIRLWLHRLSLYLGSIDL